MGQSLGREEGNEKAWNGKLGLGWFLHYTLLNGPRTFKLINDEFSPLLE